MKRIPGLSAASFLASLSVIAQDAARLDAGDPAAKSVTAPTRKPTTRENVIVYKEPGRYGGWPANQGLWQWGDELVAGFTATWHKSTAHKRATAPSRARFGHLLLPAPVNTIPVTSFYTP